MRKLLLNLAIGSKYAWIQQVTGPWRAAWAERHGWDYRALTTMPDYIVGLYETKGTKFALDLFKLYGAPAFTDYDLVAYVDTDTLWNPEAPCLSVHYDQIPQGGFAAVNVIPSCKRLKLFPEWEADYYIEIERRLGQTLALPYRDEHLNGGLVVYKPQEVAERWRELALLDSPLNDEQRLCLYELQEGRCFFLAPEWNVVWKYHVREHYPHLEWKRRSRWTSDPINYAMERTLFRGVERSHALHVLARSHVVHFATENRKLSLFRGLTAEEIVRARDGVPKGQAHYL